VPSSTALTQASEAPSSTSSIIKSSSLSSSGPTTSTAPKATPHISTLETLQAKLDRIRIEKERLTKLQELEDMEAELQREIAEEQTRQKLGAGDAGVYQSELP